MNNEDFNAIVMSRCDQIQKVLTKKAAEYARGDRLSNFKEAAKIQRTTPEQTCVNFMMKHIVSILDIVHDLDEGKVATQEMVNEKVGDAINYLILLDGLLQDRRITMPDQRTEIDERVNELAKDGKVSK